MSGAFLKLISWMIILTSLFFGRCSDPEPEETTSIDYRLFNDTPAKILARAVRKGDLEEIRHQVIDKGIDVDIPSPYYESTLLMLAVYHKRADVVKCLLELGADPNRHESMEKTEGGNSVTIAAEYHDIPVEILSLLLEYGGDPDSEHIGVIEKMNSEKIPDYRFALGDAAKVSVEKVQALLDAGADINKYESSWGTTALSTAVEFDKMDIAYYLLQRGADYTIPIKKEYNSTDPNDEENILEQLRRCYFPLDSKKYTYKLKVIDFLKERGLDYHQTPVPDRIVERAKKDYPDDWESYLEKY